jgi:hypothetical protein
MTQFRYIGAPEDNLLNLCGTVTLRCRKSDGSLFEIPDIVQDVTVIETDDSAVIRNLELDEKYEKIP